MPDLIDSGWAAWLPYELMAGLEAVAGGARPRRAFRDQLRAGPDEDARERWERFRLVAPSRIDVPPSPDDLAEETVYELLGELGLVEGDPLRAARAEPVELVLSLDEEELRELESIRMAREIGAIATPLPAIETLAAGRNDPCPCGSGKKFKRCHG